MFSKIFGHKLIFLPVFCILSFVAGGINGFLGTGGGIVFVYALSALTNNEKKDNFATSLCATIPISLIALCNYLKSSRIDFSLAKKFWLPVALGGLLGAFLVDKLKVKWLNGIFGALVVYSGFKLIMR